MNEETWIEWPQDKMYLVSSLGRFARKSTRHPNGRIKALTLTGGGYIQVRLTSPTVSKKYQAHRVVAELFIPNPENKPQVNHKNGIKTDNRVENLEWCTGEENVRHSFATGLNVSKVGEEHHMSIITDDKAKVIIRMMATTSLTESELAKYMGLKRNMICDTKLFGRSRQHLDYYRQLFDA